MPGPRLRKVRSVLLGGRRFDVGTAVVAVFVPGAVIGWVSLV